VYPNSEPEIGWFPIEPVDSGNGGDVFRFSSSADVFHWHGETFDLPAGAVHLARSAACEHQAFQLGSCAIGLQFHIETTPELVDGLITHGRHELAPRLWVQDESLIRAASAERYAALGPLLDAVLGYLHAAHRRDAIV
jgi:GMP synthase-like glutamine amidotransferase